MAQKKRGLGRGFESIMLDNAADSSSGAVTLKLNEIEPNKGQARKTFDDDALAELAESIAEHGVLQPLLVRPLAGGTYQLIAGERRWRASRMAGLTEVPVIIKSLSDEDAAVISLIENLQREDLNPVEEGFGFNELIKEYGLTQEQAAQRVGKSRSAVANALRIIKLPAEVLDMISEGVLSAGHAKAIAGLENEDKIIAAAKLICEKGLSVREAEKLVKNLQTAKEPEKKTRKTRDTYFDEVELALRDSLGRKAKVITKNNRDRGVLELEFHDKDDLAAIVNALSALE